MRKTLNGFTIVELLVVISVVGILSTIGFVSFSSIQSGARNTQRSSRMTILSEALEKYYALNGEYPSCAMMTATPSTVSSALKGLDPDVLTAPNATSGTNSISCSDPTTPNTFAYIGGGGSYTLKYIPEGSATPVPIESRQQIIAATYTLTIAAGTGGTVNAGGSYSSDTTQTITATPSAYYSFSSWTGSTGCAGVASHTIVMDANKTCTANFMATPIMPDPPTAPTVAANTVGATTTWSWGATTCTGNTARYQYRYTISPATYDSGWTATASTSVAFTTSTEGQTYTVAVQSQCYNTATTTNWSTSGNNNYYRPIPQCTLTVTSSGNGSVSGGGTYNCGVTIRDTPTITATPNTNYSFSSWSGTGCSGSASHAITMDANKTCTANFAIITYTLTTIAGPGGTVSAGGSYNAGSTPTITATPSTYYSFSSWSGTNCTGTASHAVPAMAANMSCTANFTPTTIATPAAPIVTPSTAGATTTFSWGAASCPGNTARYQYRYTISPSGYDSGLVATAATSVAFTTSTEGQTYTVATQAQCYNIATSSSWSVAGSGSYFRPTSSVPITAIGTISGTTESGQTLTAGAITPAGATVNYQWQYVSYYDESTSEPVYANLDGATSSTYALTNANIDQVIRVTVTGYGGYFGTVSSDSAGTITMVRWLAGRAGTVLQGMYVYYLNTNERWKISDTSCTSPACTSGVLSSDNSLDYSSYPARNTCKSIGGYMPSNNELLEIYAGRASYGYPIDSGGGNVLWSSKEFSSTNGYVMIPSTGLIGSNGLPKTMYTSARCVKGNSTYVFPPETPTVSTSTTGGTTTFSWNTAVCTDGIARYQYRYTITPSGYDSGLIATASTSVSLTTSTELQTYIVTAQAQCYGGANTSEWSASGLNSYYRPGWIVGNGTLSTKYIYSIDIGPYAWGPMFSNCTGPYCSTGIDLDYLSNYSLVTSNAIDFSAYPARQACKDIGGRLPSINEMKDIYNNRSSYGNNFSLFDYSTSTQYSNVASYMTYDGGGVASVGYGNKSNTSRVRCIK